MWYFEHNFKNINDLEMKLFLYESRYSLSKGIQIIENEQMMKKLCPIEVRKFFGSGSLDVYSIFRP